MQTQAALVIPAYDEPEVLETLMSLQSALKPQLQWKVYMVLNGSEEEQPSLEQKYLLEKTRITLWYATISNPNFDLEILEVYFTPKKAGVGSARKYGMDCAAQHLKPYEWIVNLDADCYVASEYFKHIETLIATHAKAHILNLGYSHERYIQIKNIQDHSLIQGILAYERHLRYYEQLLRDAGHPHACQTVGSAFAVRCDTYLKTGGMNTRKAGEDFYFIQKVVKFFPFQNDYTPIVYPSCRVSHRVPFGTGKAQSTFLNTGILHTYNAEAAQLLKIFFQEIKTQQFDNKLFDIDTFKLTNSVLLDFLEENQWQQHLKEIYAHTATIYERERRFFQWFDLFMCMKYFHYMETHGFPKVPI